LHNLWAAANYLFNDAFKKIIAEERTLRPQPMGRQSEVAPDHSKKVRLTTMGDLH
jgi:hypothetical protein